LYFRYYTQTFFVSRLIINQINKVQWVDFKLENVLVSLHSLKTMGLGPFGTSAPLFLRNGELLGHSPILKKSLKPGLWVLIAVGGANIQIVHFFLPRLPRGGKINSYFHNILWFL
jgi:hypothetical protein